MTQREAWILDNFILTKTQQMTLSMETCVNGEKVRSKIQVNDEISIASGHNRSIHAGNVLVIFGLKLNRT